MITRAGHRARRTRAYSLVEMLLALGLLGLVLLGAHSAVMIASRGTNARTSAATSAAVRSDTLARVAEDLAVATDVPERGSRQMTIIVPDRTGDGLPETIRYAWSGVSGEPLTESINGAAPRPVIASVRAVFFGYDTISQARPTTYYEDAESVIATYSTTSSLQSPRLGKDGGTVYTRAQWFTPSLPSDAVSWAATRFQFIARYRNKQDSVINVQVRTQRAGAPTQKILCQQQVSEATFPSGFGPVDVYFDACRRLLPGESIAVVLEQVSGSDHVEIRSRDAVGSASSYHLYSTNGGTSWVTTNGSLLFTIWGRVTRQSPTTYATHLTGVRYAIQVDSSSALSGSWSVPNRPEVAP